MESWKFGTYQSPYSRARRALFRTRRQVLDHFSGRSKSLPLDRPSFCIVVVYCYAEFHNACAR